MPDTKSLPTHTTDYVKGDWDTATFLGNPHLDNLMEAFIGLGAEFWAMRQRMMAMEKIMEEKGVLKRTALEQFTFTGADKAASDKERDEFLERVYGVLTRERTTVGGTVPNKLVKPRDY